MLVGMRKIEEIVDTVFYSSLVSHKPISVILVAPSGAGKSEVIMQFRNYPSVRLHGDLTTMRMAELLEPDHENKIKHFAIPDLNATLSHKQSVTGLFLSNLLTLQSEGTFEVGEAAKTKKIKHQPVGLVTACTPEMYEAYHRKLRVLGLMRRNAPIFYTLGQALIDHAQKQKRKNVIHQGDLRKWEVSVKPRTVAIGERFSMMIQMQATIFTERLSIGPVWSVERDGQRICKPGPLGYMLPLAPHDFLRSLAKGHAVRDHRSSVNQSDIDFLEMFVGFTKYGEQVQV
jgi:hypothetical protein